jgi:quinol monooxygenase YgiN
MSLMWASRWARLLRACGDVGEWPEHSVHIGSGSVREQGYSSPMATILAHLTVKPGEEQRFEAIARHLYTATHDTETGVRRYEYWRGAEPRSYYTLLAFDDFVTFIGHQTSPHHESASPDLGAVLESIRLEWVDPLEGASPLPRRRPRTPQERTACVGSRAAAGSSRAARGAGQAVGGGQGWFAHNTQHPSGGLAVIPMSARASGVRLQVHGTGAKAVPWRRSTR